MIEMPSLASESVSAPVVGNGALVGGEKVPAEAPERFENFIHPKRG